MKRYLLFIFFLVLIEGVGMAQSQRLKILGEVSTDTLKAKFIQMNSGSNTQLLVANGSNANVGTGLTLSTDSLKATSSFIENVSLFDFSGSVATSGNFTITPNMKLNQLNITTTNNQLTSNWENGKIYEITLSARISNSSSNTIYATFDCTLNQYSGNYFIGYAIGASLNLNKWIGNQISTGDYISCSATNYFIPGYFPTFLYPLVNGNNVLYLAGYADGPLTYKGTLCIRKLN